MSVCVCLCVCVCVCVGGGGGYYNKSAKGAYVWSSPASLGMYEVSDVSEYTRLSVTKEHYSKCNIFKTVGIG